MFILAEDEVTLLVYVVIWCSTVLCSQSRRFTLQMPTLQPPPQWTPSVSSVSAVAIARTVSAVNTVSAAGMFCAAWRNWKC